MAKKSVKVTVNQGYDHIRLFFQDGYEAWHFMDIVMQAGEGVSFTLEPVEPEEEEKAAGEEKVPEEKEMVPETDETAGKAGGEDA